MPTKRFHNLSQEKKNAIREATIGEFTRLPFDKVSINKIIQKAGISRGSFYTYFQDKFDVLSFIFEDAAEKLVEIWGECARRNEGNIWKAAESFLNYSMKNTQMHMLMLMKNLLESEKMFGRFPRIGQDCDDSLYQFLEGMYEPIDKTDFRDQTMENFENLISMVFLQMFHCIGWYYHHPEDKKKITEVFRKKLEILQYGICKCRL